MDCIVEDAGYGDAKQNEDVYRGLTADAYFSSRTDHETLPNIGLICKDFTFSIALNC